MLCILIILGGRCGQPSLKGEQTEACEVMKLAQAHAFRERWSQNLNLDLFDFTNCAFNNHTALRITHSGDN